ncbi:PhnD/SsuA/transferrin family substrate-binding protein [Anaerobacillus sp. HL2]|nr:PhnD/SsuA/transferrin family substrate-binding protein [Anaerobacillus sp. HL2]
MLVELNHEDAKLVEIIDGGPYAGTPPIVVSSKTNSILKQNIKEVILSFKKMAPVGKNILKELKIDEYIPLDDNDYLPIKKNATFIRW